MYDKVKTLVSREWIWETLYKTDKVACKYNYENSAFTLCHKLGTHDLNCITVSSYLQYMALKYLTTVLTEMYWTESEQW